jgi:hypothetical protein
VACQGVAAFEADTRWLTRAQISGQVAGTNASGEVMTGVLVLAGHTPTVTTSDQRKVRPSCRALVQGGRDGLA